MTSTSAYRQPLPTEHQVHYLVDLLGQAGQLLDFDWGLIAGYLTRNQASLAIDLSLEYPDLSAQYVERNVAHNRANPLWKDIIDPATGPRGGDPA